MSQLAAARVMAATAAIEEQARGLSALDFSKFIEAVGTFVDAKRRQDHCEQDARAFDVDAVAEANLHAD